MFRSKRISVVIAAVLIVACTKADKKPDGVNGNEGADGFSTFLVRSVDGKGTIVRAEAIYKDAETKSARASGWTVPREATFSFRACIDDRASRKEAVGHRFQVIVPEKNLSVLDVTPTRPNGCFTWMETIPFSFFVKTSRWIVVERDIVGLGVHSGRQRVRLAINPWALGKDSRDSGDAVVYLRDHALDKKLMLEDEAKPETAFGGETLGDDTLFIDDVSIQTVRNGERNTGTYLRFNVSMDPKVRFENAGGVPGYKSLDSGDFYVIGHLVLSGAGANLKDKVILTSVGDDELGIRGQGKVVNGKLVARLNAWVDPRLPQGNLELTLKVIPRGIRGLSSFEGIYELGALKNLSSHFSGTLAEECRDREDPCQIAPYLKTASNFGELQKKGLASHNSPYLFDRMRLRFVQVQPGETTTQRTVAYSASTCVVDAFTGDRVVGLPFIIKYKDSTETIRKATAEDGCLNWDSTIFHQYYMPEEFIEKVVTISRDTGVSRDLKFFLNPWDDKFTFGFDEREFTPNFWEKIKKREKIKARFFLADYGYHTVKFQYNIDSLMNLEVRKTVLMELQPQVLRYSGIINARKMTEPLRDGIWLLKVGIQKNYLDPAQAGVVIDTLQGAQSMMRLTGESPDVDAVRTSNRLRKLGVEAATKEYISTETTLVRVTDGVIIQPVELTMQDLRMMRVRTNMLIQLEAVDERKLQAHNALHEGLDSTINDLLKIRSEKNANLGKHSEEDFDAAKATAEDDEIKKTVDNRRALTSRVFSEINQQLNATGAYQINLDTFGLDSDQLTYLKPLLAKVDIDLQKNDFTNIRLPSCSDLNCNLFVEVNSGLEKRSFVGPVIFLSNAYKDSVRATDNLDEARCRQRVEFTDPFEDELRALEREAFVDANTVVAKERQNTFYRYNEYFGSLRHLCYPNIQHVDDLIKREHEYRLLYTESGAAVASIYRFAENFGMDIFSMADEKPKVVDISPETMKRCGHNLVACMEETEERWVPRDSVLDAINRGIQYASINVSAPFRWFMSNPDDVKLTAWTIDDLRSAMFDRQSDRAGHFAACSILSQAMVTKVQKGGGVLPTGIKSWDQPQSHLLDICLRTSEPFTWDRKLRVFQTGQNGDSYIFLGGLQLNLNVGQSFSISRSSSYTGSIGVEAIDFVGYVGGKGSPAGLLLKPASAKAGRAHSFSNSSGTTVTDSTYLVAQIAGFKVRLDEYERCVALSVRPELRNRLLHQGSIFINRWIEANKAILEKQNGVLVCEGLHIQEPRYVKESYYYFTQHFTEGDMLDQADLYNHPWLLALRGRRDFSIFLNHVRAQEQLSLGNFMEGLLTEKKREIDWPLDQMLSVYKQITPSFPGFYTEAEDYEKETAFPLERRMSKMDNDLNFEVISRDRRPPVERK